MHTAVRVYLDTLIGKREKYINFGKLPVLEALF